VLRVAPLQEVQIQLLAGAEIH